MHSPTGIDKSGNEDVEGEEHYGLTVDVSTSAAADEEEKIHGTP